MTVLGLYLTPLLILIYCMTLERIVKMPESLKTVKELVEQQWR